MIVWLRGTTFNSPNAIPIEAFKDLHTIAGDNGINIAILSHINS